MNKRYIKPEMAVSTIDNMDIICTSPGVSGEYADGSDALGKRRGYEVEEEEWVQDIDMWGNESWTRTR